MSASTNFIIDMTMIAHYINDNLKLHTTFIGLGYMIKFFPEKLLLNSLFKVLKSIDLKKIG